MRRWPTTIVLALAIAAPARSARADEPWAIGVSEAQKTQARALLDAGNTQFLDRHYAEALETYRRALAVWDHPAIRFNVVRCEIQLGRPVDAYDNLELALRYGAAPLADAVYQEALGYQKLLAGQIAEVEVRCTQPDVTVSLDGQRLLACPGHAGRRLAPGAHQVVGRRPGYLTMTRDLVVLPAAAQTVDVALVPIASAAISVRRWVWWKPWAVAGGGAALALTGGLFEWRASVDYDAYDRAIVEECATTGCEPVPAAAAALRDRAQIENDIGVVAMTVGGLAVAAGVVLLILNRAHTELPVEIAPMAGGAAVTLAF